MVDSIDVDKETEELVEGGEMKSFSLSSGQGSKSYDLSKKGENITLFDQESNKLIVPGFEIDLLNKRGQGGEGKVYKGQLLIRGRDAGGNEKDLKRQRYYAVKVSQGDDDSRRALEREAYLAMTFDHHTVAKTEMFLPGDNQDYVLMEWIQGKHLGEIAREHDKLGIFYPWKLSAFNIWAVCEGLELAHGEVWEGEELIRPGLVHRDFTPDNILIAVGGSPKLVDLGATMLSTEAQREKRLDRIKGKFGFFPPEVFEGASLDHRADIYGAGMTLYYSLTNGQNPLSVGISGVSNSRAVEIYKQNQKNPVQPLIEIVPSISEGLSDLVSKCLLDRDKRVQSASDLRSGLTKELYPEGGGFGVSRKGIESYFNLIGRLSKYIQASEKISNRVLDPDERDDLIKDVRMTEEILKHNGQNLEFLKRKGYVTLDRASGGSWVLEGHNFKEG